MGWKKFGGASRLTDPQGRSPGTLELVPPVKVFGVTEPANQDAPAAQLQSTEDSSASPGTTTQEVALSPEEEAAVKKKLHQFIAPDVAPPLKYAPILRSTLTLPGLRTKIDGTEDSTSRQGLFQDRRYMRPLMALMLFIGLGVGAVLSLRPNSVTEQLAASGTELAGAAAIAVEVAANSDDQISAVVQDATVQDKTVQDNEALTADAPTEEPLPVSIAPREYALAGMSGRLSRPRFDIPNNSWNGPAATRGPLSIRDFSPSAQQPGRYDVAGQAKGELGSQWQGGWRLEDPSHNLTLGADFGSYVGNQLGTGSLDGLSSLSSSESTLLDKVGAQGPSKLGSRPTSRIGSR